jgi:hypothetical protein
MTEPATVEMRTQKRLRPDKECLFSGRIGHTFKSTEIWGQKSSDDAFVVISKSIGRSFERNWNDLKGRGYPNFFPLGGTICEQAHRMCFPFFTYADLPFLYYFQHAMSNWLTTKQTFRRLAQSLARMLAWKTAAAGTPSTPGLRSCSGP